MQFRRLSAGLMGLLVGAMVGLGAGLLSAPMPGSQTRQAFRSESHDWRRRVFPTEYGKQQRARAATRGMKQEINWKAGQLEWIRHEIRDE